MDRRAAHHGRAGGEGADGVRHLAGVAGGDLDVLEPHAEGVGDDLREGGLVALALRGEAGRDLDLAGGLDVHVGALVGADAGALDVAGEADADPPSLRRHLGAEVLELVPADQRLELLQRRRVVAGVVGERAAVLEHQAVLVGELVGLDEVGAAHLGAVLAEVGRDRVHRPLHHEAALRSSGTAVGRDDHGVGVERLEDDAVVGRLVGAEQLGRGDDRDDEAVGRVGAVVVPELDVEPEHPAVVVEADLDVVHLRALVGRGDEVLAPVLGELHRPAQRHRRQRYEQLLGPRVVDLHAEAATHVGRDHVDLRQVEAELGGHAAPHAGRRLGRRPHRQAGRVGVPPRDGAAALHRRTGRALDVELEGQRVRGVGDRGAGVAVLLLHPRPDVAGYVVVDEAVSRPGGGDADDGRELVVGDADPRDRVLRDVAVDRDHEGDRLAHVVHLVLRQGVLRAAVGQGRVRDQQRQRLGHRVHEVVVGPDGEHALDVEHVGDVDVGDPRMRVRRAQHRGVQQPRVVGEQVVDVAALAAQEALVLDARDLGAEQLGGHAFSLPSSRWISAGAEHRLHDVLVARAATEVAGDHLPRLVLGRVGIVLSGRR